MHQDGIVDIRYSSTLGVKLTGDVDELNKFLEDRNLRPEEIVLTPEQWAVLRDSSLKRLKTADPHEPHKDRRTYCKITVRQFGH